MVLCIASTAGCSAPASEVTASPDLESDREAITAASDEHMRAVNALDVEGLLATYAEDIVNLIPGRPAMVGAATSRAYADQLYSRADPDRTHVVRRMENIEIAGDLAVEWGTILGEFDDGPVNLKYVWVWRRQADGSWKTAYNITNDDTIE